MDNPKNPKTPSAGDEKTHEVLVRFRPSELAEMKDETGAMADATAVACFVRKNLKKKD